MSARAAYDSAYRKAHKSEIAAREAAYYQVHKGERAAYFALYRKTHKAKIAAREADYRFSRRQNDLPFRISANLRTRLSVAVRNGQKSGSAVSDLGCTIPEFKEYIVSKFLTSMSWDNYGEWHLDHIRPLSSFDLTDREQFLAASHFTNYQPLWAKDNRRKGAKR